MDNLSDFTDALLRNQSLLTPATDQAVCTRLDFIVETFVIGTISLLGLIGNSFSWLVLRKDKDHPVAALLLQGSIAVLPTAAVAAAKRRHQPH